MVTLEGSLGDPPPDVPRVLLVEDEPHLAFQLKLNLEAEGYQIVHAANGLEAIEVFGRGGPFTLTVLDVMMPGCDGLAVARHVRSQDPAVGILMLTARAGETDRLEGFEAGADDYLTKPFHLKEFLLRVRRMIDRAALFRTSGMRSVVDTNDRSVPWTLDDEHLRVTTPRGVFELTSLEAAMLREFLRNPNRVLSRRFLLHRVWGLRGDVESRTVDNFVMRLRRVIEADPQAPKFLVSVRGRGYQLVQEGRHVGDV